MTIREALQSQRRVLLDLTYRNRLLSLPKRVSARSIVIHDELSAQVAAILLQKKGMTFAPVPGGRDEEALSKDEQVRDAEEVVLPQPAEDELDENGVAARHADTKLQTRLKSEHLQKRLLEIFYESRTMIEEQGVNVLFLALGELRYRERGNSSAEFRSAPLVLLPVALERKSARDRFVLKWNEDDLQENLSLREKLRADFGITLPDFPDSETFDVSAYFASIREVVANEDGWSVLENAMQLGFFSFSKLLMFLDLDPAKWPEGKAIDENSLVSGLLGNGFNDPPLDFGSTGCGSLDELVPAADLKHILDCDSSQSLAIETVRRGQNLVIQGPPGTGKSQTIANVIACAVADGKKVLFVAEKMAALEVVKRRLQNVGLGPLCLELHSNKANKRTVLDEIGRTLDLGRPQAVDVAATVNRLDDLRKELNFHARQMHHEFGAAKLTPYRTIGLLARLLPRTGRPKYRLPDAKAWSMAEATKRADVIRELCDCLADVGDVATHHWRGVAHPPVMRPVAEDLVAVTSRVVPPLAAAIRASDQLAAALGLPVPSTLDELCQQITIAQKLADAPAFDRSTIGSAVWSAGLDSLREALRNGRRLAELRERHAAAVIDVAWEADWVQQRLNIAGTGRSWFRWLNASYREAVNQLSSVCSAAPPKNLETRLALLDDLIAGNKARLALKSAESTAKAAFGSVWKDERTDWDLADSILHWVERAAAPVGAVDVRTMAASEREQPTLARLAADARDAVLACREAFAAHFAALQVDEGAAFDGSTLDRADLRTLSKRAAACSSDVDGLLVWMRYAEIARRGEQLGVREAMSGVTASPAGRELAVETFWTAFHLEMLAEASSVYPNLSRFDGNRHEERVREFRSIDRKRISIAQVEVAQAHHSGLPKSSVASVGTLGTLRAEIARKRNHMALRKLFRVCGSPIQAAKPVFMMSPLSVAQFLEPGAIEFDMLVIDEASQVEPVDALGAIARCRQVVVVGDDKQLPPTSFFSRIVGDDELDETDEGAQAKDLESVLSLCAAKGIPQRMLQWHYRSRHESLIAVSNKEFYEGKLFIVPSPDRQRRHAGLRFRHLPHGRFDRGNSFKNHAEAVAIAEAVLDHARNHAELTLGVGAMSVRQRQAITDEIELLRRQHTDLELFITRHPHEPFFVKNLENIQGDERDVILISIGYGRAKSDDKMYQGFGPLNADGGHRRLNVLITRARVRCEVFSSITADDIRVDETTRQGVAALKTFLKYAADGELDVPQFTGKGPDSPFEEAVHDVLSKHGFRVDNQVGVAGFFIDLAIVDPETPGTYLLGIECDGAPYHSSTSARDRDRLRQEVLEAHGWSIHRIWSTDWFQRPAAETTRLLNAIAAARAGRRTTVTTPAPPATQPPATTLHRVAAPRETRAAALNEPYKQANFVPGNAALPPHEVPLASMTATVERIIQLEGPIHEEEIVSRVRDLWNLGRAGSRIQSAVQDALAHAMRKGQLVVEQDCYLVKNAPIAVRDRSMAESRSLRKPELLPPQEIRHALEVLVREAHGVREDEAATAVSRLLGFQQTSQQLRERIERQIESLLASRRLRLEDGMLILP